MLTGAWSTLKEFPPNIEEDSACFDSCDLTTMSLYGCKLKLEGASCVSSTILRSTSGCTARDANLDTEILPNAIFSNASANVYLDVILYSN